MKKKLMMLLGTLVIGLVSACQTTTYEPETLDLTLVVPSGVPSYSVMKMIHEDTQFENANITYEIAPSADVLAAQVMTEEADIAIVPTNLAATLFNKDVGYQLVAAVTWGNLFVISTDENIQTWSDLADTEIHTFGRGLVPDATFRHLLEQNGLDADSDMVINYLSTPQEVAQMLLGDIASTAVLPEPVVSQVLSNRPDAQIVLDLQKEWSSNFGSFELNGYPQASLIIRKELLSEHASIMDEVIEAIEISSIWANNNPELLGEFAQEQDETANKILIQSSIERLNINFVSADEAQNEIEAFLEALYSLSPDFIGGSVPDDPFYH